MMISTFELFSIGVGPSSSHTVGPMRAARTFVGDLDSEGMLDSTHGLRIELFGSLGLTGRGHGSDRAVIAGLEGETPEDVDTERLLHRVERLELEQTVNLLGRRSVRMRPDDIILHRRKSLPAHPNGMRFTAFGEDGHEIRAGAYYSVGGGFVLSERELDGAAGRKLGGEVPAPYEFRSSDEMLQMCERDGISVSEAMWLNERATRTEIEIRSNLKHIWATMKECIQQGLSTEGVLPGRLKVPRRAASLHHRLLATAHSDDGLQQLDWVNLFALAVNEQNAGGGRVVTAPTNGAAGIIPAVLSYYEKFVPGADEDGMMRFLLCAAAIGSIVKRNASISGAEVGCQGEVGSASAMAAGALCEALGGNPRQVENAAEIALEHNLGLTCDPVGGLVQIPCIERNALAAVKAINAARMALYSDGQHLVSLDTVIRTLRDTGRDMSSKYKETSRGGLAVNVIEC